MLNGTDYAQQTRAINAIDDETIRENDFNEIRRIVCYNQSIYDDIRLEDDEWLGLTLSVDRASVLTNVRPMYDQAAIMIQDNDRCNTMLITFYNLCCIHVRFMYIFSCFCGACADILHSSGKCWSSGVVCECVISYY